MQSGGRSRAQGDRGFLTLPSPSRAPGPVHHNAALPSPLPCGQTIAGLKPRGSGPPGLAQQSCWSFSAELLPSALGRGCCFVTPPKLTALAVRCGSPSPCCRATEIICCLVALPLSTGRALSQGTFAFAGCICSAHIENEQLQLSPWP